MTFLSKTFVGAVMGAGLLAFSTMGASAEIVCNSEGVCWHTHNPYDYPPEAHVTVHENEWHWGPSEHTHSASTRVADIGAATVGLGGNRAASPFLTLAAMSGVG